MPSFLVLNNLGLQIMITYWLIGKLVFWSTDSGAVHFYLYHAKSQQKPSKGNIIERMCSVAINLDQLVGLLFLSIFFFYPLH